MKIAIKHDGTLVDNDGVLQGKDAGATLVRRLIRLFPGTRVIGNTLRHGQDFEVVPLEAIDPSDTMVINMDVLDSMHLWQTLRLSNPNPRIMNFVWWSPSELTHKIEKATFAVSCALFPTFANSEHTAAEVRELVDDLAATELARDAEIDWVNLGFRVDHVLPRSEPDIPVVLYPAIYLSDRKRPDLFIEIVDKVAARTPIKLEARLHEAYLVREQAMDWSTRKYAWVGPLTGTRSSYWQALAHTTAFLATSLEESYGLQYVEALAAGAIGVFPDLVWAHDLLPANYPYFYKNPAEAEQMLFEVVTQTAQSRAALNAAADGDFKGWLQNKHSDDHFDKSIVQHIETWFNRTL